MAGIIRDKKAVPMGELCLEMNLAPSTIYQYARLMKNVYLDIKFENGMFSVVWDEKMESITKQKGLEERLH